MALSQLSLQAVLKSQTQIVFLELLVIETPANILKLVNDNVDLDRDDGTYQRFPFKGKITSGKDKPPRLDITGDAVDQRLITEIRSLAGSREDIKMTYAVVTKQQPNVYEYAPSTFILDSITTNGYAGVTLSCSFLPAALSDAYPTRQISPSHAGSTIN